MVLLRRVQSYRSGSLIGRGAANLDYSTSNTRGEENPDIRGYRIDVGSHLRGIHDNESGLRGENRIAGQSEGFVSASSYDGELINIALQKIRFMLRFTNTFDRCPITL